MTCAKCSRPPEPNRKHCGVCLERYRKSAIRYRDENPEKVRAMATAYREAHREDANERSRAWRTQNPERVRENNRQWFKQNRAKHNAHGREWKRSNQEKVRDSTFRYKYGIGLEEYDLLLEAQEGCCAICGVHHSQTGGKRAGVFHLDHCHATGNVRGLLCHKCNLGLGLFADDPDRLIEAAAYLSARRNSRSSS